MEEKEYQMMEAELNELKEEREEMEDLYTFMGIFVIGVLCFNFLLLFL